MKRIITKDIAKKIWKYLSWDLFEALSRVKYDLVKGEIIFYELYREFLIAEEIWKIQPCNNRMQTHKQLSYMWNKVCNFKDIRRLYYPYSLLKIVVMRLKLIPMLSLKRPNVVIYRYGDEEGAEGELVSKTLTHFDVFDKVHKRTYTCDLYGFIDDRQIFITY